MDMTNGIFEIVGGMLLVINIVKLCRDKTLAGVSIWPTLHFTLWGVWNLFYYPSLGQWWSVTGAWFIVIANTVWLILVGWFKWKRKSYIPQQCTESETLKVMYPNDVEQTFLLCSKKRRKDEGCDLTAKRCTPNAGTDPVYNHNGASFAERTKAELEKPIDNNQ